MKAIQSILLGLFFCTTVGFGLWGRGLERRLEETQGILAELSAKPVVVQAAAVQQWRTEATEEKGAEEPKSVEEPEIPEDVLERAVVAREEERRQQRVAERERRRREWENQTPEEREARQAEFRRALEERASERYAEFVERAGLDEGQQRNVEAIFSDLDTRVRESAQEWAETIRSTGGLGPDGRLQLLNELSTLALDSYGWLDEVLPATWREQDGELNVFQMVGPDAMAPLMEAAREVGLHPGTLGSVMGMMMGGWRGGPRGGNSGGGPGPRMGPQ